jgi:BRCA1-associated protein
MQQPCTSYFSCGICDPTSAYECDSANLETSTDRLQTSLFAVTPHLLDTRQLRAGSLSKFDSLLTCLSIITRTHHYFPIAARWTLNMPDYFFHVAIELLTVSSNGSQQAEKPNPPNIAPFFKALRPFIQTSPRRLSRDHSYDRRKDSPRPRLPPQNADPPSDAHVEVSASDTKDPRADKILLETTDMANLVEAKEGTTSSENIIGTGIGSAISGHHMKGRYEPLKGDNSAEGWGIVHLYRDSEETSGLYKDSAYRSSDLWSDSARNPPTGQPHPPPKDDDCTTLCILAVPSYMTPSDFLSWVGESTRGEVSHFRMVRTSRANRYMVLMKFKHGKRAREWQHEWNGRVFNSIEVGALPGS